MPGEASAKSDIPIDWVDEDDLNAIESAYEAIPNRVRFPPEASGETLQMGGASLLSTPGPASISRSSLTPTTPVAVPQCGGRGQNADRSNSADLNLGNAIPDEREVGLGQSTFRGRSVSSSRRSSPCCTVKCQSSDGSSSFIEDLPRSSAGLTTGSSAEFSESVSDSQSLLEFRGEGVKFALELSKLEQVGIDGEIDERNGEPGEARNGGPDDGRNGGPGEGRHEGPGEGRNEELGEAWNKGPGEGENGEPGEGRKVRQLPAWMQATCTGPPNVVYAEVVAGGSASPVDIGRRSRETESPASDSSELNRQPQPRPWRIPWKFEQSFFTDNVKPQFPLFQFRGEIVYSKTESEVHKASLELCGKIRQMQEAAPGVIPIGFDVEWRANFERGELPSRVALLQLCLDAQRCDVMQIVHSGIPPSLQSILEDSSTMKIGVGIHADTRKVLTDWGSLARNVVDLRTIASKKIKPSRQWSLASLTFHLTGKQIDKNKGIRCGDWEAVPLSGPQLLYAATDAFSAVHVYQILSSFPNIETKRRGSAEAGSQPSG